MITEDPLEDARTGKDGGGSSVIAITSDTTSAAELEWIGADAILRTRGDVEGPESTITEPLS